MELSIPVYEKEESLEETVETDTTSRRINALSRVIASTMRCHNSTFARKNIVTNFVIFFAISNYKISIEEQYI
jgi:hypothetical protein